MMAANSLRSGVPSGMPLSLLLPCRRACRRLASNVPGLWPSSRSPAGWLLVQQRRRADKARSDSEGQRRKARQKDAAPGRVESQSAHGGGAARSGFDAVPRGARDPRQ